MGTGKGLDDILVDLGFCGSSADVSYFRFGGRDASLNAKALMEQGKGKVEAGVNAAKEEGRQILKDGKEMGMQIKEKAIK